MTMMTWTKIKTAAAILAVASLVGTGAVLTVNRARAQGPAAAAAARPSNAAQVRQAATARVLAAEKLVAWMDQEINPGQIPLTPDFVERALSAGRRLAEARVDAAPDDFPARVRAAEEYVRHCRTMLDLLGRRKGQDVTQVQVSQGAYYLADAEYLLAKLQSDR
jgi:hypothetical protein